MNERFLIARNAFFSLLFFFNAMFCCSIAVGQEAKKEVPPSNPVYTNVHEVGYLNAPGQARPSLTWVFSNLPENSEAKTGERFYYTQIPVIKLPQNFYDSQNGTVNFTIDLLSYDGSDAIRINDEDIIRVKIAQQNEISEQKMTFPLIPLSITGYTVSLGGSSGESEVIKSEAGLVGGNYLAITGTVKSESIRRELESAPEKVFVSATIFYPFRVLNIKAVSGKISTDMIDNAVENAIGRKPEGNQDVFVSRRIYQDIVRRIDSSVTILFPADMSQSLQDKWDKIREQLLQIPPVTEDDLDNVSSKNTVILPGMIAQEISPTVIKRITTALKESRTYESYVKNEAKSLKESAKKDNNAERFYNDLQQTWKRNGSSSRGGSAGFNLFDIFGIEGENKSSRNFSTEGTYANKLGDEKKAISEFQQKIADEETSIEAIAGAMSKDWLGTENYDEIQAKDFELYRVNKTLFNRSIDVFIGEFEELPRAEISRRYDLRLSEAIYEQPPVSMGTISVYWGKEDARKPNNGAPSGYLFCNGAPIPAGTQYQALREHLKSQTPDLTQDGNNTPDLRGVFLRGIGEIRPGDLGSLQNDSYKSHAHGITPDGGHTPTMQEAGKHRHAVDDWWDWAKEGAIRKDKSEDIPANQRHLARLLYRASGFAAGEKPVSVSDRGEHKHIMNAVPNHSHGGATQISSGGNKQTAEDAPDETRPVNIGVNYIIKY